MSLFLSDLTLNSEIFKSKILNFVIIFSVIVSLIIESVISMNIAFSASIDIKDLFLH